MDADSVNSCMLGAIAVLGSCGFVLLMLVLKKIRPHGTVNQTFANKGVEPVVGFRFGVPPVGLYYTLFMLAVSYVSLTGQAFTLVWHHQYVGGIVLLMLVLWTLRLQSKLLPMGEVLRLAKVSANSGVIMMELDSYITVAPHMLKAYAGLIAPYFMLSTPDLDLVGGVNATLSFMQQIISIGNELEDCNVGGGQRQFGRALLRTRTVKLLMLKAWACCTIAVQLIVNALFMHVYHPLAAAVSFVPIAFAHFWVNRHEVAPGHTEPFSCWWWMFTSFLEPSNLIGPFQSSTFGLMNWSAVCQQNLGNRPALPHCLAQAFRISFIVVLLSLDFPGAPRQPMGWQLLYVDMVEPVLSLLDCGNATGAVLFRAVLLMTGVVVFPVYLCGTAALLAMNIPFRTGQPDEDLCERMTLLQEEIHLELELEPEWLSSQHQEGSDANVSSAERDT